jgi:anti-sigma regulatory factor (Ser/Thr protein kinase)
MTDQLELVLLNQQSEVARAQESLEQFTARHQIPGRALHEVQLAFEEHLTNIVRYAYADTREHHIHVRMMLRSRELRIEVEDDGQPFNPLKHPTPDLSLPLDQRPIGGLGIHMIRKSLDRLEYRRENDRNILVMLKRV